MVDDGETRAAGARRMIASALQAAGLDVNVSGYGPLHINAVALGSFAYAIVALFLIQAFLRRHFGDRLAGGTVLLLWWASFFPWYLAEQPLTSHPTSVLLVGAFCPATTPCPSPT